MRGAEILPFRPLSEQPSGPSDAECVERARAGSRLAQTALYDRHVDRVLGRTMRLLGCSGEAEDVTHDAFLIAFQDLRKLRDSTQFGSWLMQIAVRLVHRRFRRRRLLEKLGMRANHLDCTLQALAAGGNPETALLLGRVEEVLSTLRTEVRTAWMLRFVEGCLLAEVAEQCDCSLATAKRHIVVAQARVDEVVRVRLPEEHP